MFTRIVKMEFQQNKVNDFLENFKSVKEKVRNQQGCRSLVLYRDKEKAHIFFTYSIWEDETDLNRYRNSDFFKEVWKYTKSLFHEKPEAWSVDEIIKL